MVHVCRRSAYNPGFTLVEILVALVVLSVGITIFISLFSSSLALAQSGRNQTVAAALAEEQLQTLLHSPQQYNWNLQGAAPGQLVEVTLHNEPANPVRHFAPPSILPVDKKAATRVQNLYEAFSWQVFAKLPDKDAGYVEVTVAVRWAEEGKPRVVALTSAVPRSLVAPSASPTGAEGAK